MYTSEILKQLAGIKNYSIVGTDPETVRRIDEFLEVFEFQKKLRDIQLESIIYGIPMEETESFKIILEEIKNDRT